MSDSLPPRPNLEQLKNRSKDLLKSLRRAEPEAARRIRITHPRFSNASPAEIGKAKITLSDAQLVIAREHGFASWAKLKEQVEAMLLDSGDPLELLRQALQEDDARLFGKLLQRHPELKTKVNDPVGPFDSPAITSVRSRRMLDALLEAGADINVKSRWWAGGFGLLDRAEPDLAAYAIQRGAVVDVHAAARLSMLDRLRELVSADPTLVRARGGDGQTPLHCASTVEVASFLLEHGAEIDAKDVDHESTPAQYMIGDRQELVRYLVRQGCQTDLLMAAALGDADLVRRHLAANPDCIRMRVSDEYFPKLNPHAGGTIYQWTLGWHVSAHDVARKFGHPHVLEILMERSPADVKLEVGCWNGDEAAVRSVLEKEPGIGQRLSESQRRQVAHAARNNNSAAVRLMLAAGWPVDAIGQHGATPLHWASFHGNAEMAREILRYNPPLEKKDRDFSGTPLGWAIHGSENGWHSDTGDYAATVEALLKAGAKPPEKPGGTEAVRKALSRGFAGQGG